MAAPRVTVSAVQDLAFGSVIPGVPITIQMTDADAGQYTVANGTGRPVIVQITFALPSTLADGSGQSIPISFSPVSAGFSPTGSLADVVPFDPRIPQSFTIDRKTTARVFLGGTLQPISGQTPGAYTAAIVLQAN